jgi:hypothetical protein
MLLAVGPHPAEPEAAADPEVPTIVLNFLDCLHQRMRKVDLQEFIGIMNIDMPPTYMKSALCMKIQSQLFMTYKRNIYFVWVEFPNFPALANERVVLVVDRDDDTFRRIHVHAASNPKLHRFIRYSTALDYSVCGTRHDAGDLIKGNTINGCLVEVRVRGFDADGPGNGGNPVVLSNPPAPAANAPYLTVAIHVPNYKPIVSKFQAGWKIDHVVRHVLRRLDLIEVVAYSRYNHAPLSMVSRNLVISNLPFTPGGHDRFTVYIDSPHTPFSKSWSPKPDEIYVVVKLNRDLSTTFDGRDQFTVWWHEDNQTVTDLKGTIASYMNFLGDPDHDYDYQPNQLKIYSEVTELDEYTWEAVELHDNYRPSNAERAAGKMEVFLQFEDEDLNYNLPEAIISPLVKVLVACPDGHEMLATFSYVDHFHTVYMWVNSKRQGGSLAGPLWTIHANPDGLDTLSMFEQISTAMQPRDKILKLYAKSPEDAQVFGGAAAPGEAPFVSLITAAAAATQDRESQEIFFEHISCPVFLFNFYVNEETGKIFSRSSISWHTHTDPKLLESCF